MFEQLLIPAQVSTLTVLAVAAIELATAILLLLPSTRRIGAWLASGMLIFFMIYMGVNYGRLQGEECSCFPWVKRTVGPAFFISDAVMLLFAVLAGVWAWRLGAWKKAALITAVCFGVSGVGYAVSEMQQTGLKAPDSITVAGQAFSLQSGRTFLYFYDPECMHCFQAAKDMAAWNWGDTKVVSVATREPRFAESFLKDTGFKQALISPDLDKLTQTFKFAAGPYGVALERGRQKVAITNFEGEQAKMQLKELGFVKD